MKTQNSNNEIRPEKMNKGITNSGQSIMIAYNNKSFENAVLAAIIFDPEILDSLDVMPIDFSSTFNRNLMYTIRKLEKNEEPIEDGFIRRLMEKDNTFNENEFIEILSASPMSDVNAYINVVRENTKKQKFNIELAKIIDNKNHDDISVIGEKITMLSDTLSSFNDKKVNLVNTFTLKAVKPTFLLDDFLPLQEREINLFSASGGTGKSFLCLLLLGKLAEKGKRVVGFFTEDEEGVTKDRLNKLRDIYPKLSDFAISSADASIGSLVSKNEKNNIVASDEFYKFKNICKDYDVILIDPFIAFYDQDENSNPEVRAFTKLLNKWCKTENKTIILIHHHNRGDTVRGASALVDAVRMHYTIELHKYMPNKRSIKPEIDTSKLYKRRLILQKTNHRISGSNEFDIQLFRDMNALQNDISEEEELYCDVEDNDEF